jgi:antitoxin component YwqK of YwqJK toxin-antitoxin module
MAEFVKITPPKLVYKIPTVGTILQDPEIPIELFTKHIVWNGFGAINPLIRSCKMIYTAVSINIDKLISVYTEVEEVLCKNGNIVEVDVLPNGKRHGKYKLYNKYDRLIECGSYINDKLEGKYKVIISKRLKHYIIYNNVNGKREGEYVEYEGNRITERGYYVNNQLHGENICYGENNRVVSYATYKDGLRDGIYTTYLPDGSINFRQRYENGLLDGNCYEKNDSGEYVEYFVYSKGVITEAVNCKYGELYKSYTRVDGGFLVTITNLNGTKVREWTIDRYGDKQGVYKSWQNNILTYECYYKDDYLHGKSRICNEDGILIYEAEYDNGNAIGDKIYYFENKQINIITPYVNGVREGVHKEFDEQGRLVETITYKDDYKNGIRIEYRTNGNPRSMYNYYCNRLHGAAIKYNTRGEIIEISHYYMGDKILEPAC